MYGGETAVCVCVQELSVWGNCEIVVYECERVVCKKFACKRVVCVCVQDVNWPASASVSAQQGALPNSPCCHTRLETERWPPRHAGPPANEVTDDTTSVCFVQEHMHSDVKLNDARSKLGAAIKIGEHHATL